MNRKLKLRRLEAHSLSLPQFKKQIVKSKKTYTRKPKHKQQEVITTIYSEVLRTIYSSNYLEKTDGV